MKPILVTGMPRTGTTWIGRVLASSPQIGYIHEPFNKDHNAGLLGDHVPYWFYYLYTNVLDVPLTRVFQFRYRTLDKIRSIQKLGDLVSLQREYRLFRYYRAHHYRPLIKDPFMVFSLPYLMDRFLICPVVLVRHPLEVVASFKRLHWVVDFSQITQQRALLSQLPPFTVPQDQIGRVALLWSLIYGFLDPSLTYSLEDIRAHPYHWFKMLCEQVQIPFSSVTPMIDQTTQHRPSSSSHTIYKDSRALQETWRGILTPHEHDQVLAITEDVRERYLY